jgi:hypothetical protein
MMVTGKTLLKPNHNRLDEGAGHTVKEIRQRRHCEAGVLHLGRSTHRDAFVRFDRRFIQAAQAADCETMREACGQPIG